MNKSDLLSKWLWKCEISRACWLRGWKSMKRIKGEIRIPKKSCWSNLRIVKAKRRLTSPFVWAFSFSLFPSLALSLQISLPVSAVSLSFKRRCAFEPGFERCLNRLCKYLHWHCLTPWTTYYSSSLAPALSSVSSRGQTRFFTSAIHPLNSQCFLQWWDSRVPAKAVGIVQQGSGCICH